MRCDNGDLTYGPLTAGAPLQQPCELMFGAAFMNSHLHNFWFARHPRGSECNTHCLPSPFALPAVFSMLLKVHYLLNLNPTLSAISPRLNSGD
jgi:hypothetical protein